MAQLMNVSVKDITPAKDGLREVDHKSEKFKEMVESVRARGVLNAINLRRDGEGGYILMDGLHRFTAACMAGLSEIPAQILDVGEEDVAEIQMEANLHKIETKPIEYTRVLQRILLAHPERSIAEQAERLHQSEGWLRDRLSLNVFQGRVADLVNEGDIALANAYTLAKLAKIAPDEVEDWVDRAKEQAPDAFLPEIMKRISDLKEALKGGKKPSEVKAGGPAIKLRKLGDLKLEFNRAQTAAATKGDDYSKGYLAALQFALSQDPANVAAWTKAEKEREAQKAARQAEKEAEKAAKAKAEGAMTLADLMPKGVVKKPEEVEEEATAE